MGKYRASLIHEWWSDWHYRNGKIKRTAWMADIDRIWVENRKGKGLTAVLELKWKWAVDFEVDFLTTQETIILDFFEEHGKPFYVIIIDPLRPSPIFYIHRPKLSSTPLAQLTEEQMIEWINEDYDAEFLEKKVSRLDEVKMSVFEEGLVNHQSCEVP